MGRKLNFPNLTTSNRVDQGSESSISCHFQLPRCIYPRKVRFRAICAKPPAHSDARAFSRCAPVRIRKTLVCSRAPAPVLLHKRRRSRSRAPAPARKTPAPLPHTVPAPLLKTKAGRGLCPVPPFCVPISQQAAFVGAPAVGWFSDATRVFWLRPASDCWPLCQLCGPLVTGHRAGRHPPCRLPAACALLAGAGLQLVGLRLRDLGQRNQPQTIYLRMTFWPLSSSLRAQWPQWYSASASDTVPSPNIKRCVPR